MICKHTEEVQSKTDADAGARRSGEERKRGGYSCGETGASNSLVTLLAVVLLPRLPQHSHPGLRPNGLFPRQSFQAAEGCRLGHRLGEYLDGLAPLGVRYTVRHFRASSRAVEGLEAAAHEVHIKGTIDATAVSHNRDSRFQAALAFVR